MTVISLYTDFARSQTVDGCPPNIETIEISVPEGTADGTLIYSFRQTYPNPFVYVDIGDSLVASVFNAHFRYTNRNNGGDFWTMGTFDRDEMASSLGNTVAPVIFNVSLAKLNLASFQVELCFHLLITVVDEDDEVPVFPASEYNVTFNDDNRRVNESRPLILATDRDEGVNGTRHYRLHDSLGRFYIEMRNDSEERITSVHLRNRVPLDREEQGFYQLTLIASEGNAHPNTANLTVNVIVMPICDESPSFITSQYFPSLPENSTVGTVVVNTTATDVDVGTGGHLSYSINMICGRETPEDPCVSIPSVMDHPFTLDTESGVLTLDDELDREQLEKYRIVIDAVDSCGRSATAIVIISVEDVNDNAPVISYTGRNRFQENNVVSQSNIGFINVVDPDKGNNSTVTLTLFQNVSNSLMSTDTFEIADEDQVKGLKLRQRLDRERVSEYHLVIVARDHGTPALSSSYTFQISVMDSNDNPPVFEPIPFTIPLEEGRPPNYEVVVLNATDQDIGPNALITYELPDANSTFPYQNLFRVENMTGRLLVAGDLDREQNASLSVLVIAHDNPTNAMSDPQLSASIIVNITLLDRNDEPPVILSPSGTVTLLETYNRGNVAELQVRAVDRDTPPHATLSYSLTPTGTPFQIDRTLGTITLTRDLDYDTPPTEYHLTIQVSDDVHTVSTTVTVAVQNVNDERPIFDRTTIYERSVHENLPPNTFVVTVTATDRDTPQSELRYSIVSGDDYSRFQIGASSGNITTTIELNSEDVINNYTLYIRASDGELSSPSDAAVRIAVLDINEHAPQFMNLVYNFEVPENDPPSTSVGQVLAQDIDRGNNGVVRYRILAGMPNHGWFVISSVSGQIITTRSLDRETNPSEISLTIEARDLGNQSRSVTTVVRVVVTDVNDEAPLFSPSHVVQRVNENHAIGNPFFTAHAVDADIHPNNQTVYSLSSNFPGITEDFYINRFTGELSLVVPLDYETQNETEFQIVAQDSANVHFQSTLTVHIIVIDDPQEPILMLNISTHYSLIENPGPNYPIVSFEVTDREGNSIDRLVYNVTNVDGTRSRQFGVSEVGLQATIYTLTADINREALLEPSGGDPFFRLNITATDPTGFYGSISSTLTIVILDLNDNEPMFGETSYQFEISEDAIVSDFVGEVQATDPDKGQNGTVSYFIRETSVPFHITNAYDGRITLRETLDHETVARYDFTVVAVDEGTPQSQSSDVSVRVDVTDVNDCSPVFDPRQNRTFVVSENAAVSSVVATLAVTDCDSGSFGQVSVDIAPGHRLDTHFELMNDGRIILRSPLDRENEDLYSSMVRARDGGSPRREALTTIKVSVEDYNDNPPVFTDASYTVSIHEDYSLGVSLTSVMATDADLGENGNVMYTLADDSLSRTFRIMPTSGEITLILPLSGCSPQDVIDYERQSLYLVQVIAYDNGNPRQFANKTVTVVIENVNEHRPLFDRGAVDVFVDEGLPEGTHVVSLQAYDLDFDPLSYRIDQGSDHFRWENGAIVTNRVLDHSSTPLYILSVFASERDGNLNGTISLEVFVNNINDHPPQFEMSSMAETVSEQTGVGVVVLTVHATDADNATNDAVVYSISDNGAFSIDSLSGEISVASPLDYEAQPAYTLTIVAMDTGSPRLTSLPLQVTINLVNENDERPLFNASSYTFTLEENSAAAVVGRVNATDRDAGGTFGTVRYSMGSSDHFSIDATTGNVRSTGTIDRESLLADSIMFTVIASDGGQPPLTSTADVTVTILDQNDNPPQFSEEQYLISISPTQPAGVTIQTLSASDLDEPPNNRFNYQIVTQPAGISVSVSPTGAISLDQPIPLNHPYYYSFTVQISDPQISSMFDSATVRLIVETDTNHSPWFSQLRYTAPPVAENTPVGASVFDVSAHVTDVDSGQSGNLSYSFADTYPKFSLNQRTGLITLREMLDFEDTKSFNLTVFATDNTPGGPRSASATVTVTVTGYNDNTPFFVNNSPTPLTLSYIPYPNVELFRMEAADMDEGSDGIVGYFLTDTSNLFRIGQESGVVTNTDPLTAVANYTFIVGTFDHGTPSKSSNVTVTVCIQDPGILAPVFVGISSPVRRHVTENLPIDSVIQLLTTSDPTAQSYHIAYQNSSDGTFSVTDIGLLLTASLDYEEDTQYQLILEARQIVQNRRYSSYLEVDILVADDNDNSPQFAPIGTQEISEDASTGVPRFTVTATDEDSGAQGEVHYEIISGNIGRVFSINTANGVITLAASLNRETTEAYDLVIRATDGGTDSRRDEITVHVNVLDVNDFVPTFGTSNYTISVYEYPHTRSTDRIIQLAAIDEDLGPPLTYTLDLVEAKYRGDMRSAPLDSFDIDVDTGKISVGSGINLDRENIDFYLLRVTVSDRTHSTSTFLDVHILDVNEHEPVLQVPTSEISVWELKPEGTLVTDQIHATDADSGSNAAVLFSLGEGWPGGDLFHINNVTGVIRVRTPFQYSPDLDRIRGTILAADQGVPQKVGSATITVRVVDVNDHAPQFDRTSYEVPVSIDTAVGTSLFHFNATDVLDGAAANNFITIRIPHYYSRAQDRFFSVSPEGRMTLSRNRQQGLQGNYTFRIEALNLRPLPPCAPFAQASYADVVVVVYPVNRNGPIFSNRSYTIEVPENYFSTTPLIRVSATDADNDDVQYSIVSAMNLPFTVDETTGTVRLLSPLDRERRSSYQFTIRAVDTGFPPQTSTALVSIQVLDVNDHSPNFTSASLFGHVPENSERDTLVMIVMATDPDEGTSGRVTYEYVPQGDAPFWLDSTTGELRTTAAIDYEATPSFRLSVVAMDGGGLRSMATVSVEIIGENEFAPAFVDDSYEFTVPPDARIGYSVGSVLATDEDGGMEGEVIYSLRFVNEERREYFRIVNTTGEIILNVNPESQQTNIVQATGDNPRSRRQTGGLEYFLVEAQVQATDSGNLPLNSATAQVTLQLPTSFDVLVAPSEQPIAYEIIAISIVVAVLVIIVFAFILITALICRSRKSRKMKINDSTHQPMNNHIELERYSSRNSRTSTPSSQLRHTTYSPPEHTTLNHSLSGSDSSHDAYADDEMESMNGEVSSLPRKSAIRPSPRTRSTSDLASTVGTDILTNHSQDGAFHSKTIAAIFARNQELLDSTGSQDSIHMFGSEGGGEADGRGDIDDMLFAKSFDLEDDDDSTTMAEDELDGRYQPERKSRTTLTDSRSSCNLDIPPVEDQEDDLFRYHQDTKGWIPRAKSFTDTINQMASYTSQEPMVVPRRPVGYGAYSQGSYYGGDSGSTQDSRVLLLRQHQHKHYDSDRQLHTPPEYYGHYPDPRDGRHPHHLPRAHRYGSATALMPEPHPLEYARDPLPPRNMHYSQEMHQYNRNYSHSHFIPSIQHTPPSISTPSDDGTVTPHRALASDYDPNYLSSSSTSLGSNVRDGMYAPP